MSLTQNELELVENMDVYGLFKDDPKRDAILELYLDLELESTTDLLDEDCFEENPAARELAVKLREFVKAKQQEYAPLAKALDDAFTGRGPRELSFDMRVSKNERDAIVAKVADDIGADKAERYFDEACASGRGNLVLNTVLEEEGWRPAGRSLGRMVCCHPDVTDVLEKAEDATDAFTGLLSESYVYKYDKENIRNLAQTLSEDIKEITSTIANKVEVLSQLVKNEADLDSDLDFPM